VNQIPRNIRRGIYAGCLALIPLLMAYGLVDERTGPLWAALIVAVVPPVLALGNLPPKKGANDDPR
jgi:hypothetical protein